MEGTSGGAGNENINHDIDWHALDKGRFYFWSATLFFAVRTLVYPPILIKTRLQVQQGKTQYTGTLDAFKKIISFEGLRGLYKGFLTTTIGILPTQFTYITVFETVRAKMKPIIGDRVGADITRNFIGGASASLCSSVVSVPLDVVSQLLMIQDGTVNKKKYSGGWEAAKDIYRRQGLKGFYRGYNISLMVQAPSSATWWATYNTLKANLMKVVDNYTSLKGKADIVFYGLAGSASGCVTAVLLNPLDVLKTRYQVLSFTAPPTGGQNLTLRSTFNMVWAEEGIRAFKKGITARMILFSQTSCMMVLTYETVKKLSVV